MTWSFQPISIFYSEQHYSYVTWDEYDKLFVYQLQILCGHWVQSVWLDDEKEELL